MSSLAERIAGGAVVLAMAFIAAPLAYTLVFSRVFPIPPPVTAVVLMSAFAGSLRLLEGALSRGRKLLAVFGLLGALGFCSLTIFTLSYCPQ